MIRFISGFILGYMVAKRPPTKVELEEFQADIRRFYKTYINQEK